jgi:hypothetical protein
MGYGCYDAYRLYIAWRDDKLKQVARRYTLREIQAVIPIWRLWGYDTSALEAICDRNQVKAKGQ